MILQVLVQPGSYKVRRATSPQNGPAPAATVTTLNSTPPMGPAVAGSAIVSDPVSTLNSSSTALPTPGVVPTSTIVAADDTNILWYTKERGAAVIQALLVRTEDEPLMPH